MWDSQLIQLVPGFVFCPISVRCCLHYRCPRRTVMMFPRAICFPPHLAPASAQLKKAMMWNSFSGTVLSEAARGGCTKTFEAVVATLETKLTPAEVMVKGFTSVVVHGILYRLARWRTP